MKSFKQTSTLTLVQSAIFVTLYIILDQITLFKMPQGGSITAFSMLIVALAGYLLGTKKGIMVGVAAGFLDLIFNPFVIHPLQLLLDYPLAVGALGLSGLLRHKKHGLITGYVFGVFVRFICVFLSGVIFFSQYAPENFNPVLWSFYYNILYIGTEALITVIVLFIPPLRLAIERLKQQV